MSALKGPILGRLKLTTMVLERSTKLVLIASTLTATVCIASSVVAWPALPWVTLSVLVGAFLAARRFQMVAVRVVLVLTYVTPGLLTIGLGEFRSWDLTPWFAGLLGVMMATSDPTRWHLPELWRGPLASWGLVIALSWPVIWWREFDFAPALVRTASLANNAVGVPPGTAVIWLLSVVLTHCVGLLWFDWLFAAFQRTCINRFQRVVIVPLAVGWIVSMLVAVYQSLVDPSFVNAGHWAVLKRSSGMLMDANPFGMMSALWGAIGVAMLLGRRSRRDETDWVTEATVGLVGLVLAVSWYGLWVSGSRSALIAGLVVLFFVARWAVREASLSNRGRRLTLALVAAGLMGGIFVATQSSMVGPWQRLLPMLPSASWESVTALLAETWKRNGYGAAATQMIAENPLVGVGVGTFNVISPDVADSLGYGRVSPDNAQNWFRHQLAEFRLLGSLGWMIWVWMFLRLLFNGRLGETAGPPAYMVRGALVALGAASLVGMPTQNPAVAFTFWTLAFWYVFLVGNAMPVLSPRINPRVFWVGVWMLALTYVGGVGYVSGTELRVPFRAQKAGWDYSYGFYDPELDGAEGSFRWTSERAAAVVPVAEDLIELSVWTHHPDVALDPVKLKVWLDGELVLESLRTDGESVGRTLRRPTGQDSVVIETWVSRTWKPSDYGQDDSRELGAGVRWRFYDP